ncbi:unnamed protein product [Rhizophagus irregularis]|nr:unnamed protein product [Rhizophagus irregularis]
MEYFTTYYDENDEEYEEEWEEEDKYKAYVTIHFRSVSYEILSSRGKRTSDLLCGLSIGQTSAQLSVYRKGLIQSIRRKCEKIENNNYIGKSYYKDFNSKEEILTTTAKMQILC